MEQILYTYRCFSDLHLSVVYIMKLIARVLENLPDLVLGQEPFEIQTLTHEHETLDYQLQFSDFYRLWDLAELKYQLGLTCYRLGRALNDKLFLRTAQEAFIYVKGIVIYRHPTCTTQILDSLIRACEFP